MNVDLLIKDFPAEAMSTIPNGTGLTAIKAGYVIERINQVWGYGKWTFDVVSIERIEDEVLSNVKFIPAVGLSVSQYGGAVKRKGATWGDTYKSAITDALNKCVSYFGIGNSVFKGEVTARVLSQMKSSPQSKNKFIKPIAKEKENGEYKMNKLANEEKASPSQINYLSNLLAQKKQKNSNFDILAELGKYDSKKIEDLDKKQASNFIKELQS